MIAALVHSQGVVVYSKFYALEVAYTDITGCQHVFLINCPIPYSTVLENFPKDLIRVTVTRYKATPYFQVVNYLRNRFLQLQKQFTYVYFGHKGDTYQSDILERAGIPHINVEMFGLPTIREMAVMHSEIKPLACLNHKDSPIRCSEHIVRLVEAELLKRLNNRSFFFSKLITRSYRR